MPRLSDKSPSAAAARRGKGAKRGQPVGPGRAQVRQEIRIEEDDLSEAVIEQLNLEKERIEYQNLLKRRKRESRESKYLCDLIDEQIEDDEGSDIVTATKLLLVIQQNNLKESFTLFRAHFEDSGDDEKVEKVICTKFLKDAKAGVEKADAYILMKNEAVVRNTERDATEASRVRQAAAKAAETAETESVRVQHAEQSELATERWLQKIKDFEMNIRLLEEQAGTPEATIAMLKDFCEELARKREYMEKLLSDMNLRGEAAREAHETYNKSVDEALKRAMFKVNLLPTGITVSHADCRSATVPGAEALPTKVEKVKVPSFSGQKKNYAQWKRKYTGLVGVGGTMTARIVHLIDHLGPVGVDFAQYDDMDIIWRKLDTTYTNPESVMNEIMTDLRAFAKCQDNDHLGFLRFVKMVEISVVDMNFNKLDHQMHFAEFITTLEGKLPKLINIEWNNEVTESEDSGPADIKKFLAFLAKKKRSAERMAGSLHEAPKVDPIKPKEQFNGALTQGWGMGHNNAKFICDYCDKQGHRAIMCNNLHTDGWEKAEAVFAKKGLCGRCVRKGHTMKTCGSRWKGVCMKCQQNHCQYICGTSKKEYLNAITVISSCNTENGNHSLTSNGSLLIVQSVLVNNNNHALIFYDKGSSCNLVRMDFAKRIGLRGKICQIKIVTVGKKVSTIDSELFTITMFDNNGGRHHVTLYAIPEISSEIESVDISGVLMHFEDFDFDRSKLVRPTGVIDVLLGMQAHRLHPKPIPSVEYEDLAIYSSPFSSGLILAGYDATIQGSSWQRSSIAHMLCKAEVTEVTFFDKAENEDNIEIAKMHHLNHLHWEGQLKQQKDDITNTRLAKNNLKSGAIGGHVKNLNIENMFPEGMRLKRGGRCKSQPPTISQAPTSAPSRALNSADVVIEPLNSTAATKGVPTYGVHTANAAPAPTRAQGAKPTKGAELTTGLGRTSPLKEADKINEYCLAGVTIHAVRSPDKYDVQNLNKEPIVLSKIFELNSLDEMIKMRKQILDNGVHRELKTDESQEILNTFHLSHILDQADLILHKEHYRPQNNWEACQPVTEFANAVKAMYKNSNYKHPTKNDGLFKFFEHEEWGVSPLPKCRRCVNCKECKFINTHMSHIQALEYAEMKKNLRFNIPEKHWVTRLPYKENPMVLTDNRFQVIKMMEGQEKRFVKHPEWKLEYNNEIDQYVLRGVLVELSDDYMKSWKGPVSYCSHMGVVSQTSQSTKLRVVINGSLMHNGRSLNSILMEGPNTITSLEGVLMRWREHRFCWAGDVTKMYHSIRTTEDDLNTTRIVWRGGDPSNKIRTYGHARLGMGVLSSGTISKIAFTETADMSREEYPEACQKLEDDTYIDDNISGCDQEDRVDPLVAEITEVAARGGFIFKPFVISGRGPELKMMKMVGDGDMGKVLGVGWLPMEDEIIIPVIINLYGKKNGVAIGPDEVIGEPLKGIITKRTALRASHLTYDPPGICTPITIKFKISTRKLTTVTYKEYKWDDKLPEDIANEWHVLIQEVLQIAKISFPRCVRPHHCYNDKPILIVFSDASTEALACVAYWRFEVHAGRFKCYFIHAKSRVMPVNIVSIPRAELQAGVMASRLRVTILKNTKFSPTQVYHVIDNNPMLSIINAENIRAFKEYVAVRTTEIHDNTEVKEWVWVKSSDNMADLGTRANAKIEEISKDSEWINGPAWCSMPIESWPIDTKKINELPADELVHVKAHATQVVVKQPMVAANRFSRMEKLLWTIIICRRIFLIKRSKITEESLSGITRSGNDYGMIESRVILDKQPLAERVIINKHVSYCKYKIGSLDYSVAELIAAEEILEQEASLSLQNRLENHEFRSLCPKIITRVGRISGITTKVIVIKTRVDDGLDMERDYTILLPHDHAYTRLYMKKIHDQAHRSENKVLASTRSRYWVIKAGVLAKSIRQRCFECRIRKKLHMEQVMSPMFPVRYVASPPWRKVGIDLFGPIEIKDFVKQRTSRKCWILVVICKGTRSCHIDVTEDFSAEAVLKTIMRFIYRNGSPKEITSDCGSQLTAIARRADNGENLETVSKAKAKQGWSYMRNKMASIKVDWQLTPVKGQHYNGDTERLINETKKILLPMINSTKRSLIDVQTAMFEIAYILNCRPIGKRLNIDPIDGGALCPNHMLMGRSGIELEDNYPEYEYEFSHENFQTRTRYSENIVEQWWAKFMRDCFASLAPSYTWRKLKEGLKIGDICLMKDADEIKARYKLGRVIEVLPSRMDGLGRRIVLEYKPTHSKAKGFSKTERPIQNLVLVVPADYKEIEV